MAKKLHGNKAKINKQDDVASEFIMNHVVSKSIKSNGELNKPPFENVILAKKEVDENEK